jgi:hypothetical protein
MDMGRHSYPLIEEAYLRTDLTFVNQKPDYWRLKTRQARDIHPASTSGPTAFAPRRGGRVVECTALEMRHTGNRIGSSNLPLSAITSQTP